MKNDHTPVRHIVWAASLFVAATSAPVFAADTTAPSEVTATAATPASGNGTSQLTRSDRRFIDKLAKLGLEEIALSELAVRQATSAEIRAFAQELVTAHQQANSELSQLASSKGVVLPAADTKLDKWSRKTGKEFDEDYLEKMIDAHEDSIDLLEAQADDADDAELASFARAQLPPMQAHLAKAQALEQSVR